MSPRRGGYSSYTSGYDSSPWSEETQLGLDYSVRGLYIAGFAFDILTAIAFVAFLIWSCTIRNRGLPLKGLIFTLFAYILSELCTIIYGALHIAEAYVTEYYRVILMLGIFFNLLATVLAFYVFWSLIHRLLGRLIDSGKPYAAVTIIHWILLGILSAVSLADWALLEPIVSCRGHPLSPSSSAPSAFFAVNLMWAILAIRYNLENNKDYPVYLMTARSVIAFVFLVGTFMGIVLCCAKWSSLGTGPDKYEHAAVTGQYPSQYPPGQYPAYPQYPQGQHPPAQYPHGASPYQYPAYGQVPSAPVPAPAPAPAHSPQPHSPQ
ncbi:hypothetical protein N7444_000869 [Penicillium canescens]|nr:hypothetical protein N7444_000869 [Penicillium canescens]